LIDAATEKESNESVILFFSSRQIARYTKIISKESLKSPMKGRGWRDERRHNRAGRKGWAPFTETFLTRIVNQKQYTIAGEMEDSLYTSLTKYEVSSWAAMKTNWAVSFQKSNNGGSDPQPKSKKREDGNPRRPLVREIVHHQKDEDVTCRIHKLGGERGVRSPGGKEVKGALTGPVLPLILS